MKRFFAAITAIIITAVFSAGCADYSRIDGYDLMIKAQDIYEALDSAHVTVTDKNSGLLTQDFIFKYDDGTLTYSYMGTDGDTVYYEYHNGSEIVYTYADAKEWQFLDPSDEGFYLYSKTSRHPLASRQLLSISPESITASSTADTGNGMKTVSFDYDAGKLSLNSSGALSSIGELTYFHIEAVLNENSECVSFRQQAEVINDGVSRDEDYEVNITEMNTVSKITRPLINNDD